MKKVLIVDDATDNVEVIKLMFELEGFEVLGIYHHHNLLGTISSFNPDIILLDVHLAGEDGRTISNLLKAGRNTQHIPIILMSTLDSLENSEKTYNADAFMAKPFDLMAMVDTVNRLLEAKGK